MFVGRYTYLVPILRSRTHGFSYGLVMFSNTMKPRGGLGREVLEGKLEKRGREIRELIFWLRMRATARQPNYMFFTCDQICS